MNPSQALPSVSDNVRLLQPSATLAVSALARELKAAGRRIIDLSAGEPDFTTPGFICDAAVEAIRAGHTRYTPAPGLPALRSAVAGFLAREYGAEVSPAGVVVSVGAKHALFNALFALTGPGDRVLIPVPYWTSYPEIVQLARAEPVFVEGPEDRSYRVGPAELEAAWDPTVRALILNSPSNPSGAVYERDELEAIARWAADRGVWLISDEIYARLCYRGGRAPGLLDLPSDLLERTVLINGASKAYAMTGWRIGFSYSEPGTATALGALQSHVTSNPSTPAQYAALAAFTATPDQEAELSTIANEFRERRDLVVRLVEERLPASSYVAPEGAFYLFFRADPWYDDERSGSIEFCTWLIERAEVALVPGAAFGDDRYVRLSFAASRAEIEQAFDRMARLLT